MRKKPKQKPEQSGFYSLLDEDERAQALRELKTSEQFDPDNDDEDDGPD
jgi:hypothetical protein